MGIFKDFVIALFKYSEYSEFLYHRKRRILGYGILFAGLCIFLSYGMGYLFFSPLKGNLGKTLLENSPEFRLKEGTFWVEEVISFIDEEESLFILVDTSGTSNVDLESVFEKYVYAVYIDSEKVVINQNQTYDEPISFEWKNVKIDFDRKTVTKWLNIFITLMFVLLYFIQLISFYAGALIFSLINKVISLCMGSNLTFGELYVLTLFSRTLPLLLKSIFSLFSVTVPFYWLISAAISIGIMCIVINDIG